MSVSNARRPRQDQTEAERLLWSRLRDRGLDGRKFRRQSPIGTYVVDFECREKGVVVELDGGQHAERIDADGARTAWLETQGYRVVRFWNHDVLGNIDGVLEAIRMALKEPQSPS